MQHGDRELVEHVAAAIYAAVNPLKPFKDAAPEVAAMCRSAARTIVSARMCGQAPILAAKRLAVWHDVDNRRPYRRWEEHTEHNREAWTRRAEAGYAAIDAWERRRG